MVFLKITNKYYSFLVNRKTLSYNFNQLNISNVEITPIELRFDESIYNGTIFDGILIQNSAGRTFVISDVYYFRGDNLIKDKLNHKMINIMAFLTNSLKQDQQNNSNNINVTVNKLYDYKDIKKLIYDIIPKIKNYVIRGIAFYPEFSGTKLIYMYDNDKNQQLRPVTQKNNIFAPRQSSQQPSNQLTNKPPYQSQQSSNKLSQQLSPQLSPQVNSIQSKPKVINNQSNEKKTKKTIEYNVKTDEQIYVIFEMRKTDIIDVYKLYLIEKIKAGTKTCIKHKKIDIAYIPTIECSLMCRELYKKNNVEKILVKCKFVNNKEKWQPIEENHERKYPDTIINLKDKIEILESVNDLVTD